MASPNLLGAVGSRAAAAPRNLWGVRLTTGGVRFYSAPVSSIPAAKKKYVPTQGTYPIGFKTAGINVGVKPGNTTKPDLALVISEWPCRTHAVFTKNKFQAAPVTFSKNVMIESKGNGIRGIVINSGCANAVTGKGGLDDAGLMAEATSKCMVSGRDNSTLVMSTGVIGQRLPIDKIVKGIPNAYAALGTTHDHWLTTAKAICTTDTFPKLISRSFTLPSDPSGKEYRIAGMTKGAGMIHPNMATLLGIITTDVNLAPLSTRAALTEAVKYSFNSISIDGDTSTNDTVVLLANGGAQGPILTGACMAEFQIMLNEFALDLAKLVVRDGEGATKFITIRVTNAYSRIIARSIASTIARSPLVKTAMYGKDANWGRILCATGYASSPVSQELTDPRAQHTVDPELTSVSLIPQDGSPVLELLVRGEPQPFDEARAGEILEHEDIEIEVSLGTGPYSSVYYTCDFSHEYVTINADYRT